MKKKIFTIILSVIFSLTLCFAGCAPDSYIDYDPDNKQEQDSEFGNKDDSPTTDEDSKDDGDGSNKDDNPPTDEDSKNDNGDESKKDDDKRVDLPWIFF